MSRSLAEKGWVPARYWALWISILAAALVVFYVLLTPIWIGIRLAAWAAELRERRRVARGRPEPAGGFDT